MKKRINFKMWAGVLAGNACNAFAVAAFVVPNDILMGGVTGISLTLNHAFSLELTTTVFIINMVFFLAGAAVLGRKFAVTTIAGTVLYPAFLALFRLIPGIDALTENDLLAAVFAGLLLGLGIGLIVRQGASTGGTDILAMLLNKLTHVSVAALLYVVDFVVLGMQAFFSTPEQILYGILALLLTTVVMNQVVLRGQAQIQLIIISERYDTLREKLLTELDVGVSMLHMETGLGKAQQMAVLCVIPQRKLFAVNALVQAVDSTAFTTISHVKEVRGRGFSAERVFAIRNGEERTK